MRDHALALAALGLRVHPLHGLKPDLTCTCAQGVKCKSAGKHPVLSGWEETATTDPATIETWTWEGRNIGISPKDQFTILDFDGAEGEALLSRMGQALPELPDTTPIARTGSGGIHIYISGPAQSRTRLLPGFDIRGKGGQVVAPPSHHYLGGAYSWLNPPNGSIPEAPQWLAVAQGNIPDVLQPVELVTLGDLKSIKGRLQQAFKAVVNGEPFAVDGERNSTMAALAGTVARRWPHADPEQVGSLFAESLSAMALEPGAPTMDQLVSAIRRFQAQQIEELQRRPRIFVTTDIEDMATEAVAALASQAKEIGIYTRGGQLTRVRPAENLPDGVLRGELPYAFEPVVPDNLRAHLSSSASWVKRNGNGDVSPAKPPGEVVARIDHMGQWQDIPHAERITEGMILRPDGTIFPGGGYDPSTGTVSMGHADNSPVVSVQEALDALGNVVADFPFASPAHYSAWLASILTSVGQSVFRGPSPLFLIDANVRGAGKSLLAVAAITIASGRSPSLAALGQNNEEDRKQITSMAVAGAQCIMIDNVTGLFGTPKMCEALSLHDSGWTDRLLGKSKTWSGPFKPTWWATGNNIRLQPDIARRTCYVRLSSPHEKPELRKGFAHPSLMAWIVDNRRSLYRAAVSILHHYMSAGRPQVEIPPWGTYEGWSALVRQCLVWCGLPDPADTRDDLGVADEEQDLTVGLLRGLHELGLEEFTPTLVCSVLYGSAQTISEMERYTTLKNALETGCVQKQLNPTPQSVGRLFNRFRERVADGLQLRKLSGKGSTWKIEEVVK